MKGDGLVLIGFRATGKSTIGPRLAACLDRPFVDLDAEIELAAGRSIAVLFATDGEPAFRDLEAAVLTAIVAQRPGCVLATGGGAVLRPSNRLALRRHGLIVWLRAHPATLAARLAADPAGRPSLTGLDLAQEVDQLLTTREPIYRDLADLDVDTGHLTPAEACQRIAAIWAAEHRR